MTMKKRYYSICVILWGEMSYAIVPSLFDALDDMFTHAKYMKAELEQVYPIISDGSPSYFQFEDFGK